MDEVTKRDLFAMAALQGLLACPTTVVKAEHLASECFKIADAMLFEGTAGEQGEAYPARLPHAMEAMDKGSENGGD